MNKTPRELALLAARALSEKKGREIQVLEIADLTTLADYIEPTRDFPGVEELRRTVYEDLDRGLLLGLTMTIQEMEELGNPVHHMTRDARDYLMKRGIS